MSDMILTAIADLKADMKADLAEVKDHLKTQNDRLRKAEQGVAVHWVLWMLLGSGIVVFIPFLLEIVWT